MNNTEINKKGSLGLLALGDFGLRKWRETCQGTKVKSFPKSTYKSKNKVLLIGWDAADWKVINPLMDAGLMPSLEKLVNSGVMGNIATLDPPLSPMLWTSIATGKHADKHGILGFTEVDTKNQVVRPVNVTTRKSHALWNILNNQGYKTNVVGWWPSHPAEPIDGVMVSNFFHQMPPDSQEEDEKEIKWKLINGSIHPKNIAKDLHDLRVHPTELTEEHILPFIPLAATIDQEKDKGIHKVAKMIAEASTIQAVSTHLMQYTDWDFMAVYFDSIDHFGHGFMKYHPPQMNGVPDKDFELYKDVVNSAYRYHDMMLGRMLDLVDDNTTIMLVSDHGFHSDHLRPNLIPKLPAGPALEHNPFGIVVAKGPKIKEDERIFGATLLDVCPTILQQYGLALGSDMDGKVLSSIFKEEQEIQSIPSWEQEEGNFYRHPAHMHEDMDSSGEALQQLIDLGYIDAPDQDNEKAMKQSMNEANYNLAKVYMHKGENEKAVEILEKLLDYDAKDFRYRLDLFNLYTKQFQHEKAEECIEILKTLEAKAIPNIKVLEGINLLNLGKANKALALLEQAQKDGNASLLVLSELGKTYLRVRQYSKAKAAFNQALVIDPDNAMAFHGRAVAHLRMSEFELAADDALSSIGLVYHYPAAHYHLAEALYNMDLKKESFQAFHLCLTMAPNMQKAHDWLGKISRELNIAIPEIKPSNPLVKESKMEWVKPVSKQNHSFDKKEVITIVSGLPRSGTSLMMQILEASGKEIMSDKKREADDNNPKGYYELEAVKSIFKDTGFLSNAKGKVIKIVAPLLQYLPSNYQYRVLFMQRDIHEIIKSQQVMLNKDPQTYKSGIAEHYQNEVVKAGIWANKEPNVEWIEISYSKLINSSETEMKLLSGILDDADREKALHVIDPKLYRNRV